MKRALLVLLSFGPGALPALADAPPAAGPDFQVSVVAEESQITPDVAQSTAGDMVAVWADGFEGAIKARLFDASGAPRSGEIFVAPAGGSPCVAVTPLGDFVVAWELQGQVYTRHFDRRGQAPATTFDPLPPGVGRSPDVAVDPAGNVYVVWAEPHFEGDTIMLQRRSPDGSGGSPPEPVNLPASFPRDHPRIAVDPSGSLLVSWNDHRREGGFDTDVLARRFDAPSGTWGPEVRVNADGVGDQEGSAPILYPDGTGAVVLGDLRAQKVLARRIDATGNPTGEPVQLGDLGGFSTFSTVSPAAAAGLDGTALVAWLQEDNLVHARFFDRSWSPLGEEITPSSVTTDLQTDLAVSAGGLGNFAAVWASNGVPSPVFPFFTPDGRDGSGVGVFGRAFSSLSCAAGSEALCLQGGRFQARVSWKNPFTGETGTGRTLPLTGDTGAFWFFDPANLELMVKVLDGRLVNEYFWMFYGSLSNVEYTLTLADTVTGASRSYRNPPLQFGSQADVQAFHVPPPLAARSAETAIPPPAVSAAAPFAAADCASTPTSVCPQNRFRVEVSFSDPRTGTAGQARAVQLTDDSGGFWFFSPDNLELMVKVLDGGAVNGYFWVYYGALSDVGYTITVTDTATGAQKTYSNPLHHLASGADVTAFTAGPTAR
jgi:hypothetical protein